MRQILYNKRVFYPQIQRKRESSAPDTYSGCWEFKVEHYPMENHPIFKISISWNQNKHIEISWKVAYLQKPNRSYLKITVNDPSIPKINVISPCSQKEESQTSCFITPGYKASCEEALHYSSMGSQLITCQCFMAPRVLFT